MQPLQRSYAITEERIQQMLAGGTLTKLYDPAEVEKLEEKGTQMTAKERMKLETLYAMKGVYNGILSALRNAISDEIYLSPNAFMPVLRNVLANVTDDKKLLEKIADGLSEMDKNAEIQKDRKGNTNSLRLVKNWLHVLRNWKNRLENVLQSCSSEAIVLWIPILLNSLIFY